VNRHLALSFLFALAVVLPGAASAELLVYEPFDYEADDILTGNGGAPGTTGTWHSFDTITDGLTKTQDWFVHEEGETSGVGLSNANPSVEPSGMHLWDGTVNNLATSGSYVGLWGADDWDDPDGPNTGEPGRNLDASIGLDPSVTATFESGTTTWFSYVAVRGWDRNEETPNLTIGTDPTPDGSRAASLTNNGNGIGSGGGPPRNNRPHIYPMYFAGGTPHNLLGAIPGWRDDAFTVPEDGRMDWQELDEDGFFGAVNIVVGKIEWDADTDGEDIISVARFLQTDELSEDAFEELIDATPNLSSANWDAASKPDLDQSQFDVLNIAGLKFFVDEIRIATTFEEAVPTGDSGPPCDTVCAGLTVEAIDEEASNVRATATASDGSGGSISYLFTADDGQDEVQNIGPQAVNVADFELPAGDWTISVVVADDSDCAPPSENDSCTADPISVPGDPRFRRGDGNDDGRGDLSDAVFILNYLFLGGPPPACLAAANTNGDANVDIADPTYLLNHLFVGGPTPVDPFPDCGTSDLETDANLACEETSCP